MREYIFGRQILLGGNIFRSVAFKRVRGSKGVTVRIRVTRCVLIILRGGLRYSGSVGRLKTSV